MKRNGAADIPIENLTPLDFFYWSYPMKSNERVTKATGKAMRSGRKKPTTHEIFKVFGYLYAMTLCEIKGGRKKYWDKPEPGKRYVVPPPNYGQWGMTSARFEEVLSALRLDEFTEEDVAADRWVPIQRMVDDFNDNRHEGTSPGWYLEVDESVSAWRGVDGKCSDGMPHVTKIIRKPKGVGCEIKNIACALSKIMLRLEICKGKAAERSKKFDGQYPVRDTPLPPPPRGIPPPRAPRAAARAEPPQPTTAATM